MGASFQVRSLNSVHAGANRPLTRLYECTLSGHALAPLNGREWAQASL